LAINLLACTQVCRTVKVVFDRQYSQSHNSVMLCQLTVPSSCQSSLQTKINQGLSEIQNVKICHVLTVFKPKITLEFFLMILLNKAESTTPLYIADTKEKTTLHAF